MVGHWGNNCMPSVQCQERACFGVCACMLTVLACKYDLCSCSFSQNPTEISKTCSGWQTYFPARCEILTRRKVHSLPLCLICCNRAMETKQIVLFTTFCSISAPVLLNRRKTLNVALWVILQQTIVLSSKFKRTNQFKRKTRFSWFLPIDVSDQSDSLSAQLELQYNNLRSNSWKLLWIPPPWRLCFWSICPFIC